MKFYLHYAGHVTKIATTPLYDKKPFKNLLPQNQQTDFNETWYVACGIPVQ